MNKFRFTINALVIAIFVLAFASMAQAQATRTWVSGVGDDVNPCSRTAPCKTFAGAISKTAVEGEINAIDSGGFGAVTIVKSITIDGAGVEAGILNAGFNGVNINFDSFTSAGESQKSVRLRNIEIQGADSGTRGVRITGAATGTKVYIEDCVIDGNFAVGAGFGVEDVRTGAGLLVIDHTSIRNMLGSGVLINPASASANKVSISNSLISNCAFGVAASQTAKVSVFNSVIVGNNVGLHVDVSGTTMEVDNCLVSNNTTKGFEAGTSGSTIRVANTTALNNPTLATAVAGAAVSSYGNNQTGGTAFPSTGTGQT